MIQPRGGQSIPPQVLGIAQRLNGVIFGTVFVLAWCVICFFPGWWHITTPTSVWGPLCDRNRYVGNGWGPEGFLPYTDLFHKLQYPAHNAAMKDRKDLLDDLVKNPELLNTRDFAHMTPSMYALVFQRPACLKALLAAGADPNLRDPENATALWYAIRFQYRDMVLLLLENGAKVDSAHGNKVTPLHTGIKTGYIEIIRVAVAQGVSLDLPDGDGKRPIDYALESDNLALIIELICEGASYETLATPKNPIIHLYLGLCKKLGDPRKAAEALAEESQLMKDMQNYYQRPAEFPIDFRKAPPSTR